MRTFAMGDIVELRKTHPCGGKRWEVVRLGADLGLRCLTCGHKVLLPRSTVERRLVAHTDAAGTPRAEAQP